MGSNPTDRPPGLLTLAARELKVHAAQARLARYRDKPALFAAEGIVWAPGEGPADYQLEILEQLPQRRRVAVRGPHGLGKSALAAWAILWFAITREGTPGEDWKVVTTASAWRQLDHYLWPEIHKWARRLNWAKLGREPFDERTELQTLTLQLATGEAFAVASDTPALIEGAHANHLLYVFDESKSIPIATLDAAEGALASGDCYALAISTPGEPQGRFYEIHARRPGCEDWWTRHVSLKECLRAGRIGPEWAAQRKAQWGEQSAVYRNRVLGEFASSEEDGIIPLTWIEAANERWQARQESGEWGPFLRCGVDVARGGGDRTVIALRHGDAIRELRRYSGQDTMETTGQVASILSTHGGEAVVDVIGIGAGVVDRLKEQGARVTAFNAAEHSDARDGSGELAFANKRSAAWWHLREMLDPASSHQIALPPDDLLTGDVTAPHWRMTSSGKIQVESKEEIKKRLGRSPDDGDAAVMAFWEKPAAADLIYRDYIDEYAPQREDGTVDRPHWQDGTHGYLVREFAIPSTWPRFVGIAFGGTRDTALTWWAEEPGTRNYYCYREVPGGGLSGREHARRALEYHEHVIYWVGGESSEDDARQQWNMNNVPVTIPFITDPEAATDHLIGLLRERRLFVMDHLAGLRAELGSYARDLAGGGQSGLRIAERERFRLLCSVRYLASVWPARPPEVSQPEPELTVAQQRAALADAQDDAWDRRRGQVADPRGGDIWSIQT
jgi:hypothetical protein